MKDNIPNLPGYHVTKDGKVYSRRTTRGYTKTYHPLKYYIQKRDRYNKGNLTLTVTVRINRRPWKVHRLVALAYLPNPENKPQVYHKDNNRLNNNVSNLYWGTNKENHEQMARDGRSRKGRGENNPMSKLSNNQRREIIQRYSMGISSRKLANEYGVTHTLILGIWKKRDYFMSL
jgi:hypothetical protein